MKEFRDPMSNLFCVTFDNSSIMGKFYKDITTLQKTTIDAIYKNYVDTQIKNFYYYNQNIDALPSNTINYLVGDYIRAKIGTGLNDYTFDGKFFTYKTGAFGDCIKNLAVRFMIPIEKSTCGFKLVKIIFKYRNLLVLAQNFLGIKLFQKIYHTLPIMMHSLLFRKLKLEAFC
jgi:hypothetical protein